MLSSNFEVRVLQFVYISAAFFSIARKVRWYVFSEGPPDREGVEGDPAPEDGDSKGEPPRGVTGVLGDGLVSLIRGEGRAMFEKVHAGLAGRQAATCRNKARASIDLIKLLPQNPSLLLILGTQGYLQESIFLSFYSLPCSKFLIISRPVTRTVIQRVGISRVEVKRSARPKSIMGGIHPVLCTVQ